MIESTSNSGPSIILWIVLYLLIVCIAAYVIMKDKNGKI